MDRALWLLLRLRFWGWLRRLTRGVQTVKGALLVGFLALLMCCWMTSLLSSLLLGPQTGRHANPEAVRRYGAVVLLGYCLLMLLTTAGEKALSFNPAEVNFLFPGPFSRRQLLAYKVGGSLLLSIPAALFVAVCSATYAPWLPAAFVGALLIVIFLQLFAVAVALIFSTVGEQMRHRGRRLLLAAIAGVGVVAVVWARREVAADDPAAIWQRIEQAPAFRVFVAPFAWLINTFAAENLADLGIGAVRGLGVDAVMLGLVFVLDAHYLEAAAAASERHYALLQRMRGGGAGTLPLIGPRKAGFSLPDLPRLGGAGPIIWRQLLTASRSLRGLVVMVLILGVLVAQPVLFGERLPHADPAVPRVLAGMAFALSIFLMQMLPFDFRGDVDRMEVLKSLPIAPLAVVVGQLVTPVLIATTVQILGLLAVEALLGGMGPVFLTGAVAFTLPFNVLLFEVVNVLFLFFPTRMTPATAGDLQMVGRQTLLVFGIWMSLLVLIGIPAAVAAIVYVLIRSWAVTLTLAWLMLAAMAVGLLPLLVLAFRRFDVARDTPP